MAKIYYCIECGKEHRSETHNGGLAVNPRCGSCAAKLRSTGRVVSVETKAKISASLMGHEGSKYWLGKKFPLESIAKRKETILANGGFVSPMKGRHQSELSRRKMSISQKKLWECEERRKLQSERAKGNNHNFGLKRSQRARENMSKAHIGRTLSEATLLALRIGHNKEEYRARVSERLKALHLRPDSPFKTAECRAKHSKAFKEMWQNTESKVNTVGYRCALADRLMENVRKRAICNYNNKEKILDGLIQDILPNQYKYNGGGQLGFRIYYHTPDFVNVNGQKKIIEFNGCSWHCCEICNKRHPIRENANKVRIRDEKNIICANELGYKVLTIWEHELKDTIALTDKLLQFNRV